MKTCKTGCGGKMKTGGSVKKIKKMADGGSTGLVGMPRYSNNPRSEQGRILKKGGSIKKYPDGGATIPGLIKKDRREIMRTPSGKVGVISSIVGSAAIGAKMIADKIKSKKAEKKEAAEKKKKDSATPKAKFGASVGVKASCKQGMVRGADGNCVMSRPKFQKGGSFGMLSVKAGVDKNPNPTAADRIAGAKMNKKKMGGTTRRK
jgi:hypothetical protein